MRIVVIFRSGCYVVIMWDRYVCVKAGVLRFVGRTVPELYPVAVRFYCQGSFVGLRSRYVVQRCRERVEVVFRILAKASKNNNLRCKFSFLPLLPASVVI